MTRSVSPASRPTKRGAPRATTATCSATTTASASCRARRWSWPTCRARAWSRTSGSPCADNEFAWPRLFRLRVYYDGRKTPSVDAPLGDFFGVGHGYERDLNSHDRARQLLRPRAQQLLADAVPASRAGSPSPTRRRRVTTFYYHVDWQKHPSLPSDVAYFHAYYRQERPAVAGHELRVPQHQGHGPLRRHRAERHPDAGRLVRRRRRPLLRRRRQASADLRHRHRGLLQRGLGPALLVGTVDRHRRSPKASGSGRG